MRMLGPNVVAMAIVAIFGFAVIAHAGRQAPATPDSHVHAAPAPQSATTAAPSQDMMARMKALDERIKTLTTDMNMFIGDMKVQAMASLLSAMVERDTLMRDEMMKMHDGMMKQMHDAMMKPGMPCAPGTADGQ